MKFHSKAYVDCELASLLLFKRSARTNLKEKEAR